MDDPGGPTVVRPAASTMGRIDLFLRSTVVAAQERVGEEPSAPRALGQDASSRPWRRVEQ